MSSACSSCLEADFLSCCCKHPRVKTVILRICAAVLKVHCPKLQKFTAVCCRKVANCKFLLPYMTESVSLPIRILNLPANGWKRSESLKFTVRRQLHLYQIYLHIYCDSLYFQNLKTSVLFLPANVLARKSVAPRNSIVHTPNAQATAGPLPRN